MFPEAAEAKREGNASMQQGKHVEAMLHYTKAIKMESHDAPLHSNRSLAFLKMQQFYHAHDDACTAIKLMPSWTKGYYRKGAVEFAAEHFKEAILSYNQGLSIDPGEPGLKYASTKATKALQKQQTDDGRLVLYGAGIGLVLGVACILADACLTKTPAIQNDILRVVLVCVFCAISYGLSYAYRSFLLNQRASLLEPPIDLFGESSSKGESARSNQRPKSTPQSSARRRTAANRS